MEQAQTLSNTQIVQKCYGYFSEGNIPALLNECAEDIVWSSPGPKDILPMAGTYKGRNGVGDFFNRVNESTEFLAFEPREFIAQNDKVVVLVIGAEKAEEPAAKLIAIG